MNHNVVRSLPIKVVYEKREPVSLSISHSDSFSLRDEIKKHLKLQVPSRELTLSTRPFDGGKDSMSLEQCSPRTQMSPEEEKQFLKQIQVANTVIYVVCAAHQIGDYICTGNELGSGAFSQVYRGYHVNTKQPVAIKVVDYSSLTTSKAIEYHTNERKILQSIESHPNIVKLYDLLEKHDNTSKYIYFVMEYCDGGSLDNYIRKTPLKEHQARRFILQLANGMALLESKNIIHRDLKPQNLLLTSKNMDEAVLKIADFGFGRFYTTQDLIESFPGTPLYESPDTLLNKPYNDNASDVWAMGAIFYEMVTGKVLFSNVRTMVELKAAINQEPSKYLVFSSEIEKSLSRDCKDLLFKLMEKDSRKRITLAQILTHPFLESSAKKMIYSAKDGLGFAIEITQPTSVGELRNALASHSKIPKENILLLLDGGIELLDEKELKEDFPPKGQSIYLFDKFALLSHIDIKPVPVIKESYIEMPPISVEERPFTELIKYKYKFANVYQEQKAYLHTCQKAYKQYEESLTILWVQMKSLKALLIYHNADSSDLDKEIKIIETEFLAKSEQINTIMYNFETIMMKLKNASLYGINQSNSKSLLDVSNERQVREDFANFKVITEDIRRWIDNANQVHKRIQEKPDYADIFNVYESRTSSPVQMKDTLRANVNFLQATVDTMYQNYLKVVSELDRAKKSSSTGGIRRDVTDCIEEMSEINNTHYTQAVELEKMMNNTLLQVLTLRSRVSAAISSIFDTKKQSQLISSTVTSKHLKLNDLKRLVESLQKVMNIPKAHEEFLSEMSRRSTFYALYSKRANFAQGTLLKMIEEESARMKLFKLKIGDALPQKVFPEIQVESFNATVTMTIPPAPTYPAAPSQDDDEGFTELLTDKKDIDLLMAENKRLVAELTKALEVNKEKEDVNKLKSKYEQDKAKSLEYMDEYERQVSTSKKRIRELEAMVQEAKESLDAKVASNKVQKEQILHLQKMLNEKSQGKEHLEKQLAERPTVDQLKELVIKQARVAELEEQVTTLQNELKKETVVRLQSSEGVNVLQSELRKESSIRNELSRQVDEAIQRADRKQQELLDITKKYEDLMAKCGLIECPLCLKGFSQKEIQEHIDTQHKF